MQPKKRGKAMNDELEVITQDIDYDSVGISADDWLEFASEERENKAGLDRPLNRF